MQYNYTNFILEKQFTLFFNSISILQNIFFPIEKQTFAFLQYRNFWIEFLAICSWCSSVSFKTYFHLEIPNKWKSEVAKSIKRMWQLFPTKLTDGFHCSCYSMRHCTVQMKPNDNWPKKNQGHHTHFCVLYKQKSSVVQKFPLS